MGSINLEKYQDTPEEITSSATGRPHFVALDSLRGLAALSVVLLHINWTSPTLLIGYFKNSYLMVDLFFVLSGFAIYYAYHARLQTGPEVRRFLWLRFWRIYPLHFTFLMIIVSLEFVKLMLAHHVRINHPAFEVDGFYAILMNLLLLQALHTIDHLTFNTPAWSISTEAFAYILFAILTFTLRTRRAVLTACCALVVLSALTLLRLGPLSFTAKFVTSFSVFRCISGFFAGALTYAFYETIRKSRFVCENGKLMGYLAASAFILYMAFIAFKTIGYSDFAIVPISTTLILSIVLAPQSHVVKFLSARPLRWLGAISYSVYMAHSTILWFMEKALKTLFNAREVPDPRLSTMLIVNPKIGAAAVAIAVILVLALAAATYHWIEMPLRNWSRTRWKVQRI